MAIKIDVALCAYLFSSCSSFVVHAKASKLALWLLPGARFQMLGDNLSGHMSAQSEG